MNTKSSVDFFESQFQRQIHTGDFALNPFEQATLPHLRGHILDFGCGMGNLAICAARNACSVVALDASATAISHIKEVAAENSLPIEASVADLRNYRLGEEFDAVVCIGLLMFFDCPTAFRQLDSLQEHVKPGGVAAINVLTEATNYFDMFDASGHCLFNRDEMLHRFSGWDILQTSDKDFAVPDGRIKSFVTVIARKPLSNIPSIPSNAAQSF